MTQYKNIELVCLQKGWLAVDKPCGLSVHNDPGNDLVSLMFEKIKSDPELSKKLGIQSSFQVDPVHRLDKETSGIILLAVDKIILAHLSDLFAMGRVKKKYIALVHGRFEKSDDSYQMWDAALSKDAGGRKNIRGSGKRIDSKTEYRVLDQSNHYSLLKIKLLTGRKHQIRRHAKLAGHPVTGDRRYGSKKSIQYLEKTEQYSRLGLHCQSLAFELPEVKEPFFISSQNPLIQMKKLLTGDK